MTLMDGSDATTWFLDEVESRANSLAQAVE
jgi:hypothetical protein